MQREVLPVVEQLRAVEWLRAVEMAQVSSFGSVACFRKSLSFLILGVIDRGCPLNSVQSTAKRNDPWTIAMGRSFRAARQTFRSSQFRRQPQWTELPDLVTAGGFYRSLKAPEAIWNDGFNSSAQKLDQIVKWLN